MDPSYTPIEPCPPTQRGIYYIGHRIISYKDKLRRFLFTDPIYKDYSHIFRKKTKLELILLCLIVAGIEVCYSAETAFVTPILREFNISIDKLSMIWCLSPLLGFLLTPLIGSLSDSCKSRLGRRRPVIILYSVGIITGLILLPYGKDIGKFLGKSESSIYYLSIVFTATGSVLVDFCCDACQSPARAYLIDVTLPDDQRRGLSYFTILAGLGGTCGYIIDAVDWETVGFGSAFKDHFQIIFFMVLIIFIICFLCTITSTREIPLPQLANVTNHYAQFSSDIEMSTHKKSCISDEEVGSDEVHESALSLKEYLKSIFKMPKSLVVLCLTNFFSWMGVVCYSLYFTDFVGEVVFGGNSDISDVAGHLIYKQGLRFGCIGMAIYSITCSCYSLLFPKLVNKIGARKVYMGSLAIHFVGMIIIASYPTKAVVLIGSACVGILYATLFTMPYTLISRYYRIDPDYKGKRGIGTDIAIVNTQVFVAQFLLNLVLGFLMKAGGNYMSMWVSAGAGVVGSLSAFFVTYHDL